MRRKANPSEYPVALSKELLIKKRGNGRGERGRNDDENG
jgi:hypothetical protein